MLKGLQVLRAIAACAVVYSHAYIRVAVIQAPSPVYLGHCGVDLFFVLSGFLMVHLHRESFGLPNAWREFLSRRIARIVPLYWLLTTLGVVAFLIAPRLFARPPIEWPWLLAGYLFVPSSLQGHYAPPFVVVGWTLEYEMLFYVLFAAALLFKRGLPVLFAVLIASATAGLLFSPHHPWVHLLTGPMLLEFVLGGLVALARPIPQPRLWMLVAVIMIVGGSFYYAPDPVLGPGYFPQRVWTWGVPSALLLASMVSMNPRCESLIGMALVKVGDASYSIYLSQVFALAVIDHALRSAHALPVDLAVTLLWLLTCAAGIGCWALVERHLTSYVKAWMRPREMAQEVSAQLAR